MPPRSEMLGSLVPVSQPEPHRHARQLRPPRTHRGCARLESWTGLTELPSLGPRFWRRLGKGGLSSHPCTASDHGRSPAVIAVHFRGSSAWTQPSMRVKARPHSWWLEVSDPDQLLAGENTGGSTHCRFRGDRVESPFVPEDVPAAPNARTERTHRTTAVATLPAAQNGTSVALARSTRGVERDVRESDSTIQSRRSGVHGRRS
jgi:hypothetical protein